MYQITYFFPIFAIYCRLGILNVLIPEREKLHEAPVVCTHAGVRTQFHLNLVHVCTKFSTVCTNRPG